MKILIVSDTHRQHKNLEIVLERVKPIDLFIHLGDAEGAEDYISAIADCPSEFVAGNNDFFSSLDREKEIQIGKHRLLLTHGHLYRVSFGTEYLMSEAEARNCDIAMYGHTHIPRVEYGKHTIAVNPGSISYPRQEGRRPSYIIMEIDNNEETHFTINFL